MNETSSSLLTLSDDDLMLMLCVHPEKLSDPSRWCSDMRYFIKASSDGPKTSKEADILFAMGERLRDEANGKPQANDDLHS